MRHIRRNHRRHVGIRALAASLAVVTFWSVGPAHGDPADIFSIGAPTIGSEPPKAANIEVGDARVSMT